MCEQHPCPRRRAYEKGSGRVPCIVSQFGIMLRVLLAVLAHVPLIAVLNGGTITMLRAIQEQATIGVATAIVMAVFGAWLVFDWLGNDEVERVRGRPLAPWLRRHRHAAGSGIAGGWAVMGALLLITKANIGDEITIGVWLYICGVMVVGGALALIEDAWRRGANGP